MVSTQGVQAETLPHNPDSKERDASGSDSSSDLVNSHHDSRYRGVEKAITSETDWTGPDDEANPHNWPLWKKHYHTVVICAGMCASTFAASAYTPGMASLAEDFHVSTDVAILPFSLYVLGLGCGGIFGSPCSEDYGRQRIYYASVFVVFPLFTLGSGFSKNIASLCITRFFAGFFASVALSVSNGILADVWPVTERATPLLFLTAMPLLGPAIGPLVGGYAAAANGWRWTFWCILFFCASISVFSVGMKETSKRQLLRRRAASLKIPGPASLYEGQTWNQKLGHFFDRTIVRPVHMLFIEPVLLSLGLYSAFTFAVCYSFFSGYPWIFQHYYGFDLGSIGLTFLGLGSGSVVGALIIFFVDKTVIPRIMRRKLGAEFDTASPPPLETRLYNAMLEGLLLPVSLFLFGWTAQNRLHWIAPVFAQGIFGCGYLLVFMSIVQYITMFYGPVLTASAMAGNALLRYSFAAALPFVSVQMYQKLGVGWGSSLLAFITMGFTVLPWIFWWYGPKLREKSRYVGNKAGQVE